MRTEQTVVLTLYDALQRRALNDLFTVLHPDCVAHVCPGMPEIGGRVLRGPTEWVTGIWAPIHRLFDVVPVPDETVCTGPGTVLATGVYRGTARGTGAGFEAWFVHLWRVEAGRVSGLRQVTDTVQWVNALSPARVA
jgi:ketosteroid isomerase-like protein